MKADDDAPLDLDSGSRAYTYTIAAVAAIAGLLFGFDWAVISGTVTYIERYFSLTKDLNPTFGPFLLGVAVSGALFGCIIGVCFSGTLTDRYGRRRVLIAAALLFLISAILTALPKELWLFVLARLIGGMAIGLSSPVAPMYIAEIAPEKYRGALVTLNQLAITLGIVLAYLCDWWIAGLGSETWGVAIGWRWMFASEVPPAALFALALLFVPESPRWLAKEGRWDEARQILARVGGRRHAEWEIQNIRSALDREEGSLAELLKPGLSTALIIGVGIMIFSQITGNFAVFTYTPKLMLQLGFESANSALFGMVMVGVVNFLATIPAVLAIDRLGRRPLLIIAPILMSLCMATVAINFHIELFPPLALLGCILGFVVCYAIGLGPGSWLIISEIYPTRVRGRAMSICTLSLWIVNFLTTLVFPSLWEATRSGTFWLFAMTSAATAIFAWKMIPETKGLSLEAIEAKWRDQATSQTEFRP